MRGIQVMLERIRDKLPEGETVDFKTLAKSKLFTARRQGNEVMFTIKGKKDEPTIVIIDFAEFQDVLCLLSQKTDGVKFGNIQEFRIGDDQCALNSIEGHIAHYFYGKPIGGTHTRRATYIAPVLNEAGLIKFVTNPIEISLIQEVN